MILKKNTIVFLNEIGHNNICYPDKEKMFTLDKDYEVDVLSFYNNEGFIAINFIDPKLDSNIPKLCWVKK